MTFEYIRTYSHRIHAVPGQTEYCKTTYEPLHAPNMRKRKGRPQKMRRKEADEGLRTSTRKGLAHTCSKYLQVGHNIGTCTNHVQPRSKLYKVMCFCMIILSIVPTNFEMYTDKNGYCRGTKLKQVKAFK